MLHILTIVSNWNAKVVLNIKEGQYLSPLALPSYTGVVKPILCENNKWQTVANYRRKKVSPKVFSGILNASLLSILQYYSQ